MQYNKRTMPTSDSRVATRAAGIAISLRGDQEYTLGYIPIRDAFAKWQSVATRVAELNQKVHSANAHRQVTSLFNATTTWRLRRWHKMSLEMYRDPRWARQRFWRADMLARVRQWYVHWQMDPIIEYDSWSEDLELARIIRVDQAPRAEGQIGRLAYRVTFFATDNTRAVMTLKAFKGRGGAADSYKEFVDTKKRCSRSKVNERALKLFSASKSLSQFRSRTSSRSSSQQNTESDDDSGSIYSESKERDRMTEILADRLGSESLARSFRHSVPKPRRSVKKDAVAELKRQMDTLSQRDDGYDGSHLQEQAAEETDFESTRARAEAELLRSRQRDQQLRDKLAQAQVSEDLIQMVGQSSKVNQSEETTRAMDQRIAENEQQLAEMRAMLLQLQTENTTTVHVRQYQNKAEMELERELDKITEVHAEQFRLVSDATHRTCLIKDCHAEVLKGKKMCTLGHPVSIRQLKCPWPGCGAPCCGSVEQQLSQPICYECERPLYHSQRDDRLRLQLMKDVKEASEGDGKYDKTPNGTLKGVIPDTWQVSEGANNLWRTLRGSNDPDNYLIARDATTVYAALKELVASSSTVPESKILGTAVDFKVSVRAITAAFGGRIGRNMSFQIHELAQIAGCSQDRSFLKWHKDSFKEGQLKEPDWEDPAAAMWLQHYLESFTVLLRHTLSSQVADDHARAVRIFMTAYKKEGSRRVRFTPRMIFEKHAVWIAQFFKMGEAFVEDMSYFDKLYGDFVLWNNPGTHMQAPKLVLRWFDRGVSVWDPIFERCFDEPARQAVQQEALKAYRKENPDWKKLSGKELTLESDLPKNFRKKWLEVNNSNLMVAKRKSFKWPNKQGEWVQVQLDVCFACLQSNCQASKCSDFHDDCYRATRKGKVAGGEATLNIACFIRAIRKVEQIADRSIGALSGAYVKQLAIWRSTDKLPSKRLAGKKNEDNGSSNSLFEVWASGEPQPRSDLRQPQLREFEAKWEIGTQEAYSGNDPLVQEQLAVSLMIPSYTQKKEHRFEAVGLCVGEKIQMGGHTEVRRCLIKAISYNVKAPPEQVMAAARSEAKTFIKAGEQIRTDYAHLNHVGFSDYLEKLDEAYEEIAAVSQESSLLWMKNGWLDLLGDSPVALWTTEGNRVQLQILILAADEQRCSKLDSTVSHILGHEGHAYALTWNDRLETLRELLTVSDALYRYANVSVELCIQMKDTLKAGRPLVPPYLRARASFEAMINATAEGYVTFAGRKLKKKSEGSAPEEAAIDELDIPVSYAAAAEQLDSHDLETAFCTSCKKHKAFHCFRTTASGRMKTTCESCLSGKRAKHSLKSSKATEVRRRQRALNRAICEAAWKAAWSIESISAADMDERNQQCLNALEQAIDRLVGQHITLQLAETRYAQEIHFEVRDTVSAGIAAMETLLVSLVDGAKMHVDKGHAAVVLQRVQDDITTLQDQLGIVMLPQQGAQYSQERQIQTVEDFAEMQALGASYEELEQARLTGIYGFFCSCEHGKVQGKCEQIVPVSGGRCLRCSQYEGLTLTWFDNPLECRCHCCSMCWNDDSDSGADTFRPVQCHGDPVMKKGECHCRQYVLGVGWVQCNQMAESGSNWCKSCSDAQCRCECYTCTGTLSKYHTEQDTTPPEGDKHRWRKFAGRGDRILKETIDVWPEVVELVLPQITFRFAELKRTEANGATLLKQKPNWSRQINQAGSAFVNLFAKLNLWTLDESYSDSTDYESNELMDELLVVAMIMEWQQLITSLASLWYATTYACRATRQIGAQWRWALQKIRRSWSAPLTSSQCITSNPSREAWERKVQEFSIRTESDTWSKAVFTFHTDLGAHLGQPSLANQYERHWYEFVTLQSINNWAYGQGTHRKWIQLWPKLAEVVADRHYTRRALNAVYATQNIGSVDRYARRVSTSVSSASLSDGGKGSGDIEHWNAHFETERRGYSPELLAGLRQIDRRFDLENLSPSVPRAMQRDFSKHPLQQLKQARYRATTSSDEANDHAIWVGRMLDRFPDLRRRKSERVRRATEKLSFSVSHSSMNTYISSSVSPERYQEAAGLATIMRQEPLPPEFLLPGQDEINKSFRRIKQTKLSWNQTKVCKTPKIACELCMNKPAGPNEFCRECWTRQRAGCLDYRAGRFRAASSQNSHMMKHISEATNEQLGALGSGSEILQDQAGEKATAREVQDFR